MKSLLPLAGLFLLAASVGEGASIAGAPPAIDPNQHYRLTNNFLGTARALDTFSNGDNKPFMGATDKDYSGQHWKLTPVGR